ncbi:MAG: ankyrin repeat domain-containing protein [Betaproteobacteria bacterium]|nr:ankyrin repeat domain-containing protein [Betaproteobacteria bacterium]
MTDIELKTWLVQMGFSAPSATIANAMTPLMHAARLGDRDVVRALLHRGAEVAARNADGNGALWFACFADCEACVADLIAAGAPLDNQNVNGASALIYCASAGKAAMVRRLLEAGADPDLKTLDDYTALDSASTRACLDLLRRRVRPS